MSQRLEGEVGEQRRLLGVIQELETPIMPILAGVLVLPLVGHLDSRLLGAQVALSGLQPVTARAMADLEFDLGFTEPTRRSRRRWRRLTLVRGERVKG